MPKTEGAFRVFCYCQRRLFCFDDERRTPDLSTFGAKQMKQKIIIAALMLAATQAQAARVSPLYAEYPDAKRAGVLTVANTANESKSYQVTVNEWVVVNGKKTLKPVTDLRFIPTIFTVKPKAVQTVRWVNQNKNATTEHIYRIRVDELPTSATNGGVTMALNSDFPWIWRPQGMAPQLSARWDGTALIVKNNGTATAQLTDLVAGSVNKKGLIGYVLPGEEARFDVGAKAKVAVSIKVNGKDATLDAK
jgi:P pilus assembly chaperone PapD